MISIVVKSRLAGSEATARHRFNLLPASCCQVMDCKAATSPPPTATDCPVWVHVVVCANTTQRYAKLARNPTRCRKQRKTYCQLIKASQKPSEYTNPVNSTKVEIPPTKPLKRPALSIIDPWVLKQMQALHLFVDISAPVQSAEAALRG